MEGTEREGGEMKGGRGRRREEVRKGRRGAQLKTKQPNALTMPLNYTNTAATHTLTLITAHARPSSSLYNSKNMIFHKPKSYPYIPCVCGGSDVSTNNNTNNNGGRYDVVWLRR